MTRQDLNRVSVANKHFDRAVKRSDNKLKESDRPAYLRAWDRAGQIIKRNRAAGRI